MKRERRRTEIRKFVNNSPVTLTAADIAKIFKISKPTAGWDLDYLLKYSLIDKTKVRRNWDIKRMYRNGRLNLDDL